MGNTRINLFHYTAASNPYSVKSLAHKYGYECDKDQSLASVLQQLVSYEGEPVLFEIIENSPDKELFFEYFKKMEKENQPKKEKESQLTDLATYMNFSGQIQAASQVAENKVLTRETSLMVSAGAILIAFAIIVKK